MTKVFNTYSVMETLDQFGDIQGANYQMSRMGVPDYSDWDEMEGIEMDIEDISYDDELGSDIEGARELDEFSSEAKEETAA